MADDFSFALNRQLDEPSLRARYAQHGRIQILDFLARDGAERLRDELSSSDRWRLVLNGGPKVFEIRRAKYLDLPAEERAVIQDAVHTAAREGFQYRYETIRVADAEDERQSSGTLLDHLASFFSSDEVVAFVHRLTGNTELSFADAQGTRYLDGDFLTAHDDVVAAKNRGLAYVLGLTPTWSPDWGGLLHFHPAGDGVVESFVPRFNALSLFAVGQRHSVGFVAPFAGEARLSVTGWFRSPS